MSPNGVSRGSGVGSSERGLGGVSVESTVESNVAVFADEVDDDVITDSEGVGMSENGSLGARPRLATAVVVIAITFGLFEGSGWDAERAWALPAPGEAVGVSTGEGRLGEDISSKPRT